VERGAWEREPGFAPFSVSLRRAGRPFQAVMLLSFRTPGSDSLRSQAGEGPRCTAIKFE